VKYVTLILLNDSTTTTYKLQVTTCETVK